MNGLYPIIRRVRRPLLPLEPPAESKSVAIKQREVSKADEADALVVADEEKSDASGSNK